MNITTNYNNFGQTRIMAQKNRAQQNNNHNALNTVQHNYQNNPNINFTGMEKFIKPVRKLFQSKEAKSEFNDLLDYASSVLDRDTADIEKNLIGKTQRRIDFFGGLVTKYNNNNFYAKPENKERIELVDEIFDLVKNPTDAHFYLIENTNLSLKKTKQIFEKLDNNPKKINQAVSVYKDLENMSETTGPRKGCFPLKRQNELIMDIINSPNADEYLSNYSKYKPYIFKHGEDKNIIGQLDEKIASKSYDSNVAKSQHQLQIMFSNIAENNTFNRKTLLGHYSKEGNDVIETVARKININRHQNLSDKDSAALLDIYKTTNKKNIDVRMDFLENTYYNGAKREAYSEDEFQNLGKLFNMMDENPKVNKFIDKMNTASRGLGSADKYLTLMDEVDISVLNRDVKKIAKIINGTYFKPEEEVLKFYRTEPQTVTGRMIKSVKDFFKKKPVEEDVYEYMSPEKARLIATRNEAETVKAAPVQPAEPAQPVQSIESMTAAEKPAVKRKIIFKQYVEKQPSAKKMVVINDVNNLIEKKLGKNVYADQSKSYANKATKMRLNMLPEIFDSIKDTRAAARKNGTFNKRTTVKNEDALGLYRRINGKNKQLVNYMLKVRNEDGTRKYNVNDIVNVLDNTNRTAIKMKASAPKENPFRAKDEKVLYKNILDEHIAEFGKLKKAKSDK